MPKAIDLDHVALAAADTAPLLHFLTGELGGTALWGGHGIGFRPMQVLIGDETGGMKIELLEPWAAEQNDFLQRFVERHHSGPHHMTFKVPDIHAAIAHATELGYPPVSVNTENPEWREAFLMPKQSHGTVIQLAQSDDTREDVPRAVWLAEIRRNGPNGNPRWWQDPQPARGPRCFLRRVVVAVADFEAARRMYTELLGATIEGETAERCDFVWPGGARVAIERTDGASRVDRLEIEGLTADHEVLHTRFTPSP